MLYYRVTFYVGNSIIAEIKYFKKFKSFIDLVNWCNEIRVSNKYSRYLHKEITYTNFINN